MKKYYQKRKLSFAGLITFIVIMVGLHLGAFAQNTDGDDCIAPAQPIQTYNFYTTQNGGETWDLVATKIIKSGQTVPHPEFNVIDYSTFDSWYTVNDPDLFSSANKFPDENFSTPQMFTESGEFNLYASYTLDVYHVIFMDGVGNDARVFRVWEIVAGTEGLNADNERVIVDATTRSIGWYSDQTLTPSNQVTTFTMPNQDITLYPDIKTGHWLRFDSEGGSYVEPAFYHADAVTAEPSTTPVRPGYDFNGWLNGTTPFQFGSTLTEDVTLTADWEPMTVNYTVVYWVENADDENYSFNNSRTATVLAGAQVTTLPTSYTNATTTNIKDGLNAHVTTFSYDKDTQADAANVTIDGDGSTVINLYYKRATYTLNFYAHANRYSLQSYQSLWYEPSKTNGYPATPVQTLTAKYQANIYDQFQAVRATFTGNHTINTSAYATATGSYDNCTWVDYDEAVYSGGALSVLELMPGVDLNLVPRIMRSGGYTYTYYYYTEKIESTHDHSSYPTASSSAAATVLGPTDNYSLKGTSSIISNNNVNLLYTTQYPVLTGFTKYSAQLSGFTSGGNGTTANPYYRKEPNENRNIYLYYIRNTYNITFNNAGSDLTDLSETRKYEQPIGTLPELSGDLAPAGKTDFTFGGWYQNELCEGDPIDPASIMPASDIILYAKWNAPDYTAVIHLTTSATGETQDVVVAYGQTVPDEVLAATQPCPDGDPAAGWNMLEEDGTQTVFEGDMRIYRDIVLVPYCLLGNEEYSITYNMNCDGAEAVVDNSTYADGSNPMVLPPSQLTCQSGTIENDFLGWEEVNEDGDHIVHLPYNGIFMTGNKTLTALWGSGTEHTAVEMVENHPTEGQVTGYISVITNGTTELTLPENFERDSESRPNDWFIGWARSGEAQVAEFGPNESVVLSCNATIYPVWLQVTPNDLNQTVCTGNSMDLNTLEAFTISNDEYVHGTIDNIVSKTWNITKDGAEFIDHENGNITNAQPGEYVVSLTITTTKGLEKSFENVIELNVVDEFTPVFNSFPTAICEDADEYELPLESDEVVATEATAAVPSVTGTWHTSDGATVTSIPTTTAGTLTLTFVPDAGQCASSVTKEVVVNELPDVTVNAENIAICDGETSTVTASGAFTYVWDDEDATEGATLTVNAAGTYKVTGTDANGCSAEATATVTVNAVPTVTLTVPTTAQALCPNQGTYEVSANVTGGTAPYTYEWTGATAQANDNSKADVEQELESDCTPNGHTYTVSVVVTDANGCASAEAEKSFTVQMAAVGITIDDEGVDNSMDITCPADADVPPTAFPVATDACGNTLENPTLKSVSEIPACAGENGSVVTYTYTYTDCAGNSADWEFTYNISAPAAPTLELNAATATPANDAEHPCAYVIPEVTFEATAACDGDITSSTQNPEAGTFVDQTDEEQTIEITVSVVDGCGASATGTTTVTIPAKPTVTITPSSTTACYGSNVTLEATEGFQEYNWNYDGLHSQTITAEVLTETTTFTVTVTDANGCTATASQEVTVGEIGTVEITGDDEVCENGDVTLSVPESVSYMWSTQATTQSITVSKMTATTTFYVTVTDASGCVSEGEKEVVVNTLPDVTIDEEESVAICDGETVTLTASGASTYVWNDEVETEGATLTVDAAGTYTVTGTDANGCENTATVEVTVNELPNVTVNAENIAICDGETATVTASGAETYVWNDEDETEGATLTVSGAGTYKVTGTDANGCTAEATATVTVNPLPVVTLNSNSPVCSGETVTVTATSTTATSYSWNNGDWADANQQTYTASQQNISVKVKDAKGCVSEAVTTSVTVNPLPNVTATANPATIYYGGTSDLSATGASTYSWNVTNTTVSPEQTTTYTVTGTDANGCENTATVTVTVQNAQVTFDLDTTKVYDGTVFVVTTADLQSHITGLVDGHVLASGTITSDDYVYGNYTCAEGSSFAPVEGVAVKSGFRIDDQSGNDVTAHYTPAFHVTLHITQQPLTVTAASDSKLHDGTPLTNDQYTVTGLVDGDELVAQVTGSQTEVGTSYNLVGTVNITRGNRDVTESYDITKVKGTLTITSADCQGVTYQDYYYPAVQIGTQCWLAENLRNTVYGPEETTAIENYAAFNNDPANMEKFGYLYTWYSAVGVEENNDAEVPETLEGTSLVQGICPEGWVVPSQTDFDILYIFTANEARRLRDKNTMYWIPGEQGVEPNYHFNSRAGGFYNSTSGQFERMLLEDYYWTSTSDPNSTEVTSPMNAYYCNSINFQTSKKSDMRSVRCISQQTAYGAPTETEEGEGDGE